MDFDDEEAAVPAEINAAVGAVQFCCDVCGVCPIVGSRWHCAICKDFDLCTACYDAGKLAPLPPHTLDHPLSRIRIAGTEPGTQPAAEGDDTEGDDNAEGDDTEGDNTEGDELASFINDDTAAQPEAAIDSDCEDEMLAMAVAMSLGKEPAKASPPPASAKSPPPMAMLFLELMTRHLPQLTSHDGLGVLPYLQLLQLLATQHAAGASAKQWVRLADAILAILCPVKESAVSVGKRTPRLELHTLLLMLLCLLLQKESRAAAVSVPEVEQPDVRALQTELVAQLRAAGLGELLYAHALKLFDHFKEAGAAKERSAEAATPGGTNAPVVREQPSATRPLAPFFAEGYGKAHPDLFEDVRRLLLETALRLAQRLQAHQRYTLPADASTAASASTTPEARWRALLVTMVNSPWLVGESRKPTKKLLLQLCGGSKQRYAEMRDSALADSELGEVRKLIATQTASGASLTYEGQVALGAALHTLCNLAAAQPRNWLRYCSRSSASRDGALCFLARCLFEGPTDETLLGTLRLLSAGLLDRRLTNQTDGAVSMPIYVCGRPGRPPLAASVLSTVGPSSASSRPLTWMPGRDHRPAGRLGAARRHRSHIRPTRHSYNSCTQALLSLSVILARRPRSTGWHWRPCSRKCRCIASWSASSCRLPRLPSGRRHPPCCKACGSTRQRPSGGTFLRLSTQISPACHFLGRAAKNIYSLWARCSVRATLARVGRLA